MSLVEKARQRAQERARVERAQGLGLGAQLKERVPLRLQWRMASPPGLIDPISDAEAERCGVVISPIIKRIRERVERSRFG